MVLVIVTRLLGAAAEFALFYERQLVPALLGVIALLCLSAAWRQLRRPDRGRHAKGAG